MMKSLRGFRCPKCEKVFCSYEELYDHRRNNKTCSLERDEILDLIEKTRKELGIKPKKKQSVNLKAIEESINDGRLSVWIDGNGLIHIRNNHSKNEITFTPSCDMEEWMEE